MAVDPETWRNSRPRKRMGAGLLVRDGHGRVLLVEPTYKETWEVPGGAVEADESPRAACEREALEELGVRLEVGRLLCIEWQGPEPGRTESLMFLYDGGLIEDAESISLADDELASFRFVELEELDALTVPRLSRRIRAAHAAFAAGDVAELDNGVLVCGPGL